MAFGEPIRRAVVVIDPITKEKLRQCERPGCGKMHDKVKEPLCKECRKNAVCSRRDDGHCPLSWTIYPCPDGTVYAKCGDCQKQYVHTYPPSRS
jgi:hypothetical protein